MGLKSGGGHEAEETTQTDEADPILVVHPNYVPADWEFKADTHAFNSYEIINLRALIFISSKILFLFFYLRINFSFTFTHLLLVIFLKNVLKNLKLEFNFFSKIF